MELVGKIVKLKPISELPEEVGPGSRVYDYAPGMMEDMKRACDAQLVGTITEVNITGCLLIDFLNEDGILGRLYSWHKDWVCLIDGYSGGLPNEGD